MQYLLDHMCKVVFFTQEKLDVIVEFLSEKFRVSILLVKLNCYDLHGL